MRTKQEIDNKIKQLEKDWDKYTSSHFDSNRKLINFLKTVSRNLKAEDIKDAIKYYVNLKQNSPISGLDTEGQLNSKVQLQTICINVLKWVSGELDDLDLSLSWSDICAKDDFCYYFLDSVEDTAKEGELIKKCIKEYKKAYKGEKVKFEEIYKLFDNYKKEGYLTRKNYIPIITRESWIDGNKTSQEYVSTLGKAEKYFFLKDEFKPLAYKLDKLYKERTKGLKYVDKSIAYKIVFGLLKELGV